MVANFDDFKKLNDSNEGWGSIGTEPPALGDFFNYFQKLTHF